MGREACSVETMGRLDGVFHRVHSSSTTMFNVTLSQDSSELKELIDDSGIDEEYNYGAEYHCVGKDDGKIVGVITYRIQTLLGGSKLPRFEHVIFDKSIRRSKKIVIMLLRAEKLIKNLGYKQVFCLVNENKQEMITYAKKFGFKEYGQTEQGKLLYKNIGE